MSEYYDWDGDPITMEEWIKEYERPRHVAETTLPDGKYVSTVYLGLDHSFGGGPPLIFETMVFPGDGSGNDLDMARYSTKEEAEAGHEAMVAKWSR